MPADLSVIDPLHETRQVHYTGIFKIINVKVNDGVTEKKMPVYVDTSFHSYVRFQTSGDLKFDPSTNQIKPKFSYVTGKQNDFRYILKQFSPVFQNTGNQILNGNVNSYPTLTEYKLKNGATDIADEKTILEKKGITGSHVLAKSLVNGVLQGGGANVVYELAKVFGPNFTLTYPTGSTLPVNNLSTESFVVS